MLTLLAFATLAPGTYQLAVIAAANGADSEQATMSVTVSAVTAGAPPIFFAAVGEHSCALTTDGTAYCWGYNGGGGLGNSDTSFTNPTPLAVSGGLAFESLSISKVENLTCGLATGGEAYCWGNNDRGQLGDGTTTPRLIPTRVAGGLLFTSIAVGNSHVCAVDRRWHGLLLGDVAEWRVRRRIRRAAPDAVDRGAGSDFSERGRGQRLHLCAVENGRCVLLGPGRAGPARQRSRGQQHRAGGGLGRAGVSIARGWESVGVRPNERQHRLLLGQLLVRDARRRS